MEFGEWLIFYFLEDFDTCSFNKKALSIYKVKKVSLSCKINALHFLFISLDQGIKLVIYFL